MEAADPYWIAKKRRVATHNAEHRAPPVTISRLSLPLQASPNWVSSPMLRLLQNEGVWTDDLPKRTRNLEGLRFNADRCQGLFLSW